MSRKKNIFSMYRVLLLAATLPLVAVLLGVTTASMKATSKEVKNLTKNYMLSIVEQCGSALDSALFKGEDDTLSYNSLDLDSTLIQEHINTRRGKYHENIYEKQQKSCRKQQAFG